MTRHNVRKQMKFSKFSTKVIVMTIVIFCVVLPLLMALLIYRETVFLEENYIRRGQDMLTGVREASRVAILAEDAGRLENIAAESMKHRQEIRYIVFYRSDWKRIYSSATNTRLPNAPRDPDRELRRQLYRMKEGGKEEILVRNTSAGKIPVTEFWTTISFSEFGVLEMFADQSVPSAQTGGAEISGYIRLGVSSVELETIIGRIIRDSIIAGLLTLMAMSIATAWLMRRLMSPFSELVNGVQAVAEGDMDRTISVRSMDEVSRLANEFNKMVIALKERQLMLIQSEYKFRSLFERIHSGILIFDQSGDILDSNPAMAKMVGYENLPTLTSVAMELFFKNPDDYRMLMYRVREECDIPDLQLVLTNKQTGKDVETNVSITCQTDADGTYEYSEAVFVDITHITELEKRLLHAHKMEAVGTLAGGIAHDFNNILTVIAGRMALMAMNPVVKYDEKLNENLLEIEQSVTRAGNLVSQILGFARKGMYKEDHFHLNKVAREVRSLLSETIDRRIALRLDLASDIWLTKGDESQIFQSLLNICLNGCDAMPDGGRLTIATGKLITEEELPAIDNVMPPGHYVFLQVADTGQGMDQETVARIFDPFFTTKEVGKGTGLGMAMVHGIVSNHRGYLRVESQKDRGTAVTVYLPAIWEEGGLATEPDTEAGSISTDAEDGLFEGAALKEKPLLPAAEDHVLLQEDPAGGQRSAVLRPAGAPTAGPADTGTGASRAKREDAATVLIVDDEETILRVNRMFFSSVDDYILLTAASGEESIEMLKQGVHVDIVVMDISMPGMGGEKAFRVIHELFPDLPVVVATGHAQDETVNSMLESGAVDLILKPYIGIRLVEVLNKYCPKRGDVQ